MRWAFVTPVLMLCVSNVFMTFAWYGQFKFPARSLWVLVLAGWGLAFFEYCLAVPANHMGHKIYSTVQLKTMQEVITLVVFAGFSVLFLGETLKWNHAVSFGLIVLGCFFAFKKF